MKRYFTFILILMFSFYVGCVGNGGDEASMNFIIPPESTMNLDYSTFNQINTKSVRDLTPGTADMDGSELLCWGIGSVLVLWSNVVCFTPIAVPITIYKVLKTQIPTESSDTHVVWSYSHDGHKVVITADKKGGYYDWEWSVNIDDFEWITGGSMEDLTEGWWQFHSPLLPEDSNETIGVVWIRTDDENNTVTFTNNNVNDVDQYGDFIEYMREGDNIYVRFHDVKDEDDNVRDITVYWNIVDHSGGISINDENEGTEVPCEWNPND